MGNVLSHEEGSEDEDVQVQEKQPEFAVQNGSVPLQNSTLVKVIPSTDQVVLVDGKQVTRQKSIISSSEKMIVFSPIANGGIDSKPPAPTAQSKFRLSISRPPSGRTIFQVNGLEGGKLETPGASEGPLITENQNDTPVVLETSVTKVQNQPPPSSFAINTALSPSAPVTVEPPLAASVSSGLETPPKPKEISFFQRIFMPEKKVQIEEPSQPQLEENEEAGIMVKHNAGLQSMPVTNNPQAQNIDDFNQEAVKEFSSELAPNQGNNNSPTTLEASLPAPPPSPPEVHPVMSFFKTLVSPNKSVLKSEEESKKDSDDKKNGGLRKSSSRKEKAKSLPQQTAESEAKSPKKSDSPKSRTLSRLFGHKSKKGEDLSSGNKVVEEQPVAVTVNSEQPSPEQILTQDTKPTEPNVQPQITAPASKDEGKAAKESIARPRPFWRKSFKGDSPTTKQEENASAEKEAKADAGAQAATSSGKGLESPDKGKKTEDGKNSKPKLMMFFKQLSVIGDGGNGNSEEVNEKSTGQSTLDLTDGAETTKSEKTVVAAVVEPPPPAPKIKENQKEKKVVAEKITKQESKDMPEAVSPTQQQVSDPALVQNGADTTKDGQLKRTEKRQSLGSFFKAIGPKRLSDAAVQTDPVCILPAEKAK
uniref:Breast carcinoma amplified sequence 1 n=1 Tax=Xenopus tropicalis TaxID=8364 RepID=A0A803JH10_XENTR